MKTTKQKLSVKLHREIVATLKRELRIIQDHLIFVIVVAEEKYGKEIGMCKGLEKSIIGINRAIRTMRSKK